MRLIAPFAFFMTILLVWSQSVEAKKPSADGVPTALQEYVAAEDEAFAWKILKNDQNDGFLTYDIDLTSQVWQGITWKHALTVVVPPDVRHTDTVLLFIMGGKTGGRPGDEDPRRAARWVHDPAV